VIEERNQRVENDPGALFGEQMRAAQFLNHPYGIPIIGWRHEIETLDTEDAIAFNERYYAPDNAILVVAGDVTAAEVLALAEQHYGPLEPAGNPPDPRPKEPPQIEERRMSMEHPQVRQPYVLRYYTVPAYSAETAKDAAALDLVVRVLGSGITSMLSETVQIADGKAIGVGAWYSSVARDSATLAVWGIPADGVSLPELETAMDDVIETLKAEGPDAEQLERVRKSVLANEIYRLDDLAGRARQYGGALASGLTVEDVAAWPGLIEAATADEVRDAARKFLVPERSTTGYLMGPGEAADAEASEKEAG
jgi:zinc protease